MHLILFLKPTKQKEMKLEQPKKKNEMKSKTKQKERTLKNTKIQT